MQAGGHRFDPVHLHQFVDDPGKKAELSVVRLVLVFYQQAVLIFKKMEEVKAFQFRSLKLEYLGLIVSTHSTRQKGLGVSQARYMPFNHDFEVVRGFKVIGSSEQVHVVDALAITGDEGRSSLR